MVPNKLHVSPLEYPPESALLEQPGRLHRRMVEHANLQEDVDEPRDEGGAYSFSGSSSNSRVPCLAAHQLHYPITGIEGDTRRMARQTNLQW